MSTVAVPSGSPSMVGDRRPSRRVADLARRWSQHPLLGIVACTLISSRLGCRQTIAQLDCFDFVRYNGYNIIVVTNIVLP